jgi:hypothetical protein
MGKTHSKPLAARHGRETAWARHAMCKSALSLATNATSIQVMSIVMYGREIVGQRRQNRGISLKTDKATNNYEYSGRERCTAFRTTVIA